jgi:hypothetical protein
VNHRLRKFIAAIEILGGFAGMGLTSSLAMGEGLILAQRIMVSSIGVPFALAAYAGRALWLDQDKGYWLSMAVQAAQVPAWSSPAALYVFYCGGQLGAWFGRTTLAPRLGLGSHLTLSWSHQARGVAFGLNFLALWAFWQLARGWSVRKAKESLASVDAPA